MRYFLNIFFASMCFTALSGNPVFPASSFEYLESTGDKKIHFRYNIKNHHRFKILTSYKAGKIDTYVLDQNNNTLEWKRKVSTDGTDFTARKEGDTILISGIHKGRSFSKSVRVKGTPWYQHIAFCLSQFVTSGRQRVNFFVLRPADFKSYQMKALKKRVDSLKSLGKEMVVQKIRVTLSGWLSKLWHGNYWYDNRRGYFIRYEGVNGPPGTTKTVITLKGLK